MSVEQNTAVPTVSHMLGELTWLLTQSPLHRHFTLADLEWLVMPALLAEQFYVFRDGDRPIGLATWAYTTPEGEAKLGRGMIEPANRLSLDEWRNGDRVWLVDLVAPFATEENRHREIMMADLIAGPLSGKAFSFHSTDPQGSRTVGQVPADASERLADAVRDAVDRNG